MSLVFSAGVVPPFGTEPPRTLGGGFKVALGKSPRMRRALLAAAVYPLARFGRAGRWRADHRAGVSRREHAAVTVAALLARHLLVRVGDRCWPSAQGRTALAWLRARPATLGAA